MPRHWYLKTRHRVLGPITSKQLIGLAAEGKLQPCHGVSSDGETWIKAKMIVGLPFPTLASSSAQTKAPAKSKAAPAVDPVFRLWIKTSRGTAGPFTLSKAKRLIEDGRIRPNSPASRDGKSWGRADRFEELGFPLESIVSPVDFLPTRENVEAENVEAENVEPANVEPANVEPANVEPANVEPANVEIEPENFAPESVIPEPVSVESPIAPSLASEPSPTLLKRRWLKSHFQSSLTIHAEDENGIEILCFAPSAIRPFATLMTNGLNAAVGVSGIRNELILYVPQEDIDLVALLRYVATMVNYAKRHTQTDIESGAVIPNGNPASPITPGSHLDHFLFLSPPLQSDANLSVPSVPSFQSDQCDASVLWLHPITTAEMTLRSGQGLASLVSQMHWAQASCVLDLFRKDVTESSFTANAWPNPAPVSGSSLAENSAFGT